MIEYQHVKRKDGSVGERRIHLPAVAILALALSLAGCGSSSNETPPEEFDIESMNAADTTVYYETNGVVLSVNPDRNSIVVKHERIPDFMSAMTMPFFVKDSTVVDDVYPQDSILFSLSVTGSDIFISSIDVLSR